MSEAETRDPNATPAPHASLEGDLRAVINRHCVENDSNTPDFILAQYLVACLNAFRYAVNKRESWYGRDFNPLSAPADGVIQLNAPTPAAGRVATEPPRDGI